MKGYLKNPKATEEAFAGGWFHTGDLAVIDASGYVKIKDRSKDIIISGGENISTIEVEDVLYSHPHVLEAAVVAKPDEKWGETPCAFVTLKAGAPAVTGQDIIEFCRGRLARFKCPRTGGVRPAAEGRRPARSRRTCCANRPKLRKSFSPQRAQRRKGNAKEGKIDAKTKPMDIIQRNWNFVWLNSFACFPLRLCGSVLQGWGIGDALR